MVVQVANIHRTDLSDGYEIATDETYIVSPGTTVAADNGNGVSSVGNRATLLNHGNIASALEWGASFVGSSDHVINTEAGIISGVFGGLSLNGHSLSATNFGTFIGTLTAGAFFGLSSTSSSLDNHGLIYSLNTGITGVSNSVERLTNSGKIEGALVGYDIVGTNAVSEVANIFNSGTLRGSTNSIHSGASAGTLHLVNSGTLSGGIDLNAVNRADTITNAGKIVGLVHLGPGADTFTNTTGTSGKVFGEAGADKISGGPGAEIFDGGPGHDELAGGRGRDVLIGGAQSDFFVFKTLLDSVKGPSRDQISDFNRTQVDRIDLHGIDANTHGTGDQKFSFIGTQAFHSHGHTHVYGELRCVNHLIQGDVNGDGRADFEIHVNLATMVQGDFIL
jgi:hypothetical protein